jgi:hypothetical protein
VFFNALFFRVGVKICERKTRQCTRLIRLKKKSKARERDGHISQTNHSIFSDADDGKFRCHNHACLLNNIIKSSRGEARGT